MVVTADSPKVSVILATYNSSSFLPRSVNSVLNQSYNNIELVIVDDGSTDNTFEVLFPYLRNADNIKYLRHSNRKHPLSLNAGLLNSTGSLITFIDADDEYMKDHIKLRVEFLSCSNADLIHSPALLKGDESSFYVPDAADTGKLIHINECIIGGTLFGKREVFIMANGFRDMYSHDSDFVNRVSGEFIVKRFDSATYIYHRDNPESVTLKMSNAERP